VRFVTNGFEPPVTEGWQMIYLIDKNTKPVLLQYLDTYRHPVDLLKYYFAQKVTELFK
jgi:hypothetical protein